MIKITVAVKNTNDLAFMSWYEQLAKEVRGGEDESEDGDLSNQEIGMLEAIPETFRDYFDVGATPEEVCMNYYSMSAQDLFDAKAKARANRGGLKRI